MQAVLSQKLDIFLWFKRFKFFKLKCKSCVFFCICLTFYLHQFYIFNSKILSKFTSRIHQTSCNWTNFDCLRQVSLSLLSRQRTQPTGSWIRYICLEWNLKCVIDAISWNLVSKSNQLFSVCSQKLLITFRMSQIVVNHSFFSFPVLKEFTFDIVICIFI